MRGSARLLDDTHFVLPKTKKAKHKLIALRKSSGLTAGQIGERTDMSKTMLWGLESNNITAGATDTFAYGKNIIAWNLSFLKLCALYEIEPSEVHGVRVKFAQPKKIKEERGD